MCTDKALVAPVTSCLLKSESITQHANCLNRELKFSEEFFHSGSTQTSHGVLGDEIVGQLRNTGVVLFYSFSSLSSPSFLDQHVCALTIISFLRYTPFQLSTLIEARVDQLSFAFLLQETPLASEQRFTA